MARYRITNFGATRKFPYNGICYEISRLGSIETDDRDLAIALDSFLFVDMEEVKAIPPEKVESEPESKLAVEEVAESKPESELAVEEGVSEKIVKEGSIELSKESDNDGKNIKIKRRRIKGEQNE